MDYRLVPLGNMSLTDLFELLSRLTIHIDEDLRSQAVTSLLSFTQDFPDNRDDVIATFVSFILKQVGYVACCRLIEDFKPFC